jgi:hypothetical protein
VVNIIKGEYEQRGSLSEEEIKKGTVLACRTNIKSDRCRSLHIFLIVTKQLRAA